MGANNDVGTAESAKEQLWSKSSEASKTLDEQIAERVAFLEEREKRALGNLVQELATAEVDEKLDAYPRELVDWWRSTPYHSKLHNLIKTREALERISKDFNRAMVTKDACAYLGLDLTKAHEFFRTGEKGAEEYESQIGYFCRNPFNLTAED